MLRSYANRLDEVVTGNWQFPSVAIEALALLGAALALKGRSELVVAIGVALWLAGIAAYCLVVPLIVRRFRRLPSGPSDLTPDCWTLMAVPSLIGLVGTQLWVAMPISVVASTFRALYEPMAFAGLTISAALAPAWIVLQIWRLVRDRSSRRYSPTWWGLVFPTAIVIVAAQEIGVTFGVSWLHPAAAVGYWCVLAAWAIVGTGLVRDLPRADRDDLSDVS
jgi:tellurite resistance protein TehA-like permease